MTSTFPLLLRLAVIGIAGLGASSLAACGRKGDPEVPTVTQPTTDRPVGIPVGPTSAAPKAKKEPKPFFLDPLL